MREIKFRKISKTDILFAEISIKQYKKSTK